MNNRAIWVNAYRYLKVNAVRANRSKRAAGSGKTPKSAMRVFWVMGKRNEGGNVH